MKRRVPLKETRVSFYRSRGPGGQRKNKRETAVRILHIPTGVIARASEFRSQADNRELALERLAVKLDNLGRKRKARLPTAKPASVKRKEKMLGEKHSGKKRMRRKVSEEENGKG